MSGDNNKDGDTAASPTATSNVILETNAPNEKDLSKFSPPGGNVDELVQESEEPKNGSSDKKSISTSSKGAAMQRQYLQYQVGLGQQPHYLYPQQHQTQTQSSAPSSPSQGAEFDAQTAMFMQQQGASTGNPFRANYPGIPNLPLTAQTQSAPSSTQGGMGILGAGSTGFSNYNPRLDGGGTEVGAATAAASYMPSGSPVQGAYTSQATGMYAYGDGVLESPHWPDRNMQQGQHLYQPHHMVQPQQMSVPHYSVPSHGPSAYGNRGSPPFADEMTPNPAAGNMENQESFSSYTQNQASMSGSNLAAASTTAPLWAYQHQMTQMENPAYHQAMPGVQHKTSTPHPQQHLPYFLTPGPPIQTTDNNKGPDGANLFIFHIPNHFTNIDLYNLFCAYGQLISVRIMVEKDTGRSRGFGFVSYDNPDSAALAIKELNGLVIANKRLKVQHKQIRASDHPNLSGGQAVTGPHQQDIDPSTSTSNFDMNSAGFGSTKVAAGAPLWYDSASTSKPFPEEAMAKISQNLESSVPSITTHDSAATRQRLSDSSKTAPPKKSMEQPKKSKEITTRSQDPKFPQQQLTSSRHSRTNRKGADVSDSGLNRMGTLRNALPDSTS